jgi:hypothetical protein
LSVPAALNLSRQKVTYDVAAIRAGWQQCAVDTYDAKVGENLARLAEIERTAWAAWDRSVGEVRKTRTESEPVVVKKGEPATPAELYAMLQEELQELRDAERGVEALDRERDGDSKLVD